MNVTERDEGTAMFCRVPVEASMTFGGCLAIALDGTVMRREVSINTKELLKYSSTSFKRAITNRNTG